MSELPLTSAAGSGGHHHVNNGSSASTVSSTSSGTFETPMRTVQQICEEYLALVERSQQLFSGLRDLPQFGRQWLPYFQKAFEVYTRVSILGNRLLFTLSSFLTNLVLVMEVATSSQKYT